MPASLRDLAADFHADLDPSLPAEERALLIAQHLASARPDTTARGRQRAAAEEAGAELPLSDSDMDSLTRPPRVRARAAARRAGRAGRRTPRLVRGLGFRRGQNVRGLVFQALGLVALYYVIKTPDVIGRVTSGVRSVFRWVSAPRGVPKP